MANNVKVAVARRNAMIDNFTANLNSGYLRIYTASQPTDADTALGAQTLLAELRFGSTAFAAASSGSAAANAITADASANGTGTAAWFRALKSDGSTVCCDGTVGTSGCDLNLDSVSIVTGAPVTVTSMTITQ